MANPSDQAIVLIYNYITTNISGGFSNNNDYLSNFLNNPYYEENPIPPDYIPTDFNASNIMNVLSPSSIHNVLNLPCTATDVLPLLNGTHDSDNLFLCNVWAQAYYASQSITLLEYLSVTGIINTFVLDTSYLSGISWAQVNLGRPADPADIAASR